MAAASQFVNHLDNNIVVFHTPKNEDFEEILEAELRQVQERFLSATSVRFFFRLAGKGREFLLMEGMDRRYGARQLRRAIECYLVCPLEKLLATAQIRTGEMFVIDRHPGKKALAFFKDKDRETRDAFAPCVPQTSNHFASTPTAA